MLQHHNALLREQIDRHGGRVVKSLGDGFMVSFDSARTAVSCAIGMQAAIAEDNRSEQGAQIQIGVGINLGEPVREGEDLLGGAVNLASRICAAAGPGEILVSEAVRAVLGRTQGFEYQDRGLVPLKGFPEPQHLFEIGSLDMAIGAVLPAPPSAPTRPSGARSFFARIVPAGTRMRAAVAAAATLALAAAVVLVTPFVLGTRPAESNWKLLRSDDFSDPTRGLFLDGQRGSQRWTVGNLFGDYQWEFGYAGYRLVGRLNGRFPAGSPLGRGWRAGSFDKVLDDFAVEVRAQGTISPSLAAFGIAYVLPGELYEFEVWPAQQRYYVRQKRDWYDPVPQAFDSGRSSAIGAGGLESRLRFEVMGDTLRVFVDGRPVDRVQRPGLSQRGGTVWLSWYLETLPGSESTVAEEVEVRFNDFRVYSLP